PNARGLHEIAAAGLESGRQDRRRVGVAAGRHLGQGGKVSPRRIGEGRVVEITSRVADERADGIECFQVASAHGTPISLWVWTDRHHRGSRRQYATANFV